MITIIFVKNAIQFIKVFKVQTNSIAINVICAILDSRSNISIATYVSYASKEKKKTLSIVKNVINAALAKKKIAIIVILAYAASSKINHSIVINVNLAFKSNTKTNIWNARKWESKDVEFA